MKREDFAPGPAGDALYRLANALAGAFATPQKTMAVQVEIPSALVQLSAALAEMESELAALRTKGTP